MVWYVVSVGAQANGSAVWGIEIMVFLCRWWYPTSPKRDPYLTNIESRIRFVYWSGTKKTNLAEGAEFALGRGVGKFYSKRGTGSTKSRLEMVL